MTASTVCAHCGSVIPPTDELHLIYGDDWCASCADNTDHEGGRDTLIRPGTKVTEVQTVDRGHDDV